MAANSPDTTVAPPSRGAGKAALLEAVVRITANEGLRGVTYRTVAKEAGVSYGLVTYHFGSRDTMIAEALAMTIERGVRAFPEPESSVSVAAVGADLVEVSLRRGLDQRFQYEVTLEASRKPELKPLVDQIYTHYRGGLIAQLEHAGITDPQLHQLVFAACEGMTLLHSISGDTEQLRQTLDALHRVLEHLSETQGAAA